jgi:hypothetical protein
LVLRVLICYMIIWLSDCLGFLAGVLMFGAQLVFIL